VGAVVFGGAEFQAFSRKVFILKKLGQITVLGMGLLGGSVARAVLRCFSGVRVVGYSHRASTRRKARELGVATEVVGDIRRSVAQADIVILATPVCTFEEYFGEIAGSLKSGCIVTDVGSTKVLPGRWASKRLPRTVHYVGSHPIAGSEQGGVEFARDDLFEDAICVLTTTAKTERSAVQTLKSFWSELGCVVKTMRPAEHDRVFANVSHLPHVTAAALINASKSEEMKMAGRGFLDTSRIASGPVNIWSDILRTNSGNVLKAIDRLTGELGKLKRALESGDRARLEGLLKSARDKRGELMKYKMKRKELVP